MPQLVLDCIESWHKFMPDWEYVLWDENRFDVHSVHYVSEAYALKKYAFVSDYVRLHALYTYGGVYLDTDVEVFKSFENILSHQAFAGFEGSKRLPVGTCVIGSEENGEWVARQLDRYSNRHFVGIDGQLDLTTNVQFITADMISHGLICDGRETELDGIHIFPVDYFSPRKTTGEFIVTENTFCDHRGMCSWNNAKNIPWILKIVGPGMRIKMIKIKRRLIG